MSTRVVIRHQSGTKANKVEQIPLDGINELTIGRDPASTITYDPQGDDAVSRRHAVIKIVRGDPPAFMISDLNSSNGTYVNGARIATEIELMPTDTVQLGSAGPSFTFDLDPRPIQMPGRIHIVDAGRPKATRVIDIPAAGSPLPSAMPFKVGVGRETVARMLSEERRSTSRAWMYTLAGVLLLVATAGAALYLRSEKQKQETAARLQENAARLEEQSQRTVAALATQRQEATRQAEEHQRELARQIGMTPSQIFDKYANATVLIDVSWRVYDRMTGKALFQKTCRPPNSSKPLPCFVRLRETSRVVRWLTTEDDGHNNIMVGAKLQATGFVVNENGFILTNKHVASAWMVNYNNYLSEDEGYVCNENVDPGKKTVWEQESCRQANWLNLFPGSKEWRAERGGLLFDANQAEAISLNQKRDFEGRNDVLQVRFPGSRVSMNARLVRASDDADVALIRIDSAEPLAAVDLAPDDSVTIGGNITVLGYPETSVKTYAVTPTIENGEFHMDPEFVPEPTVTPGVISLISITHEERVLNGSIVGDQIISKAGDVYQLTAATSAGNSGGPVFDSNGKVIALFTYGSSKETVTRAVPIHYGRDLMPVQRRY